MHFTTSTIAAVAAFAGSAAAHVVLNEPKPYDVQLVQVNPLDGDQFNYPCQIGEGDYGPETDGTEVQAGSTTPVSFTGSAVHGGGSCQFSVTYEWPPKADPSTWKVVHSIIGGCPTAFDDNLPETGTDEDGRSDAKQCGNDSGMDCVRTFNVPIPEKMKSGRATFAWSWFNKIGNREMYMNCAPITITGGAEDDSFVSSLPDMFVANIPGYCKTADGSHIIGFPEPGESVMENDPADAAGMGECPAPGQGGGNGGGAPPTEEPAPEYPTEQPAEEQPEDPGHNFAPEPEAPVAENPVAEEPVAEEPAQEEPAVEEPVAEEPAPQDPGYGTPTPSFATVKVPAPTSPPAGEEAPPATAEPPSQDAVKCDPDGAVVCMGENYFGLCNHGYAVPQLVSYGTYCTEGSVQRRSTGSHVRRHLLHANKHF